MIVIPGYGLAVAQAQHLVREMADLIEKKGGEVKYASTRWPAGCPAT